MAEKKSDHHSTANAKDVIYIDVDDEITAVIEKVRASDNKIVALVLPKRAAVLQSIVNMRLLKRAAGTAKKNLVLITSEQGLMPLAGAAGLHVAKSLNSKPEIPEAPEKADEVPESVEEAEDSEVDKSKTVGELAGASAAAGLDDDIKMDSEESPADAVKSKAAKLKKKFKIPDFNKFRILLILGVAGVLIFAGLAYAAVAVLPKATVTIKTDSEAIDVSAVLTLNTNPETPLDAAKGVVPAQKQETKKTVTATVPATGQQNNGEKASGSVAMTATKCGGNPFVVPASVPSGSGISSGGQTYITQKTATFVGVGPISGGCYEYSAGNIGIVAQSPGASYNVSSANFTVSGRSDVSATGSASGGTDNIAKVVSSGDIDKAKQQIAAQDVEPIKKELRDALIGRSLYPIDATFTAAEPQVKTSVNAGQAAEDVTVTQETTYSMLGVQQADLEKVIDEQIKDDIDTDKQTVLDYGLNKATFGLQEVKPDGAVVDMQLTVIVGTELDANEIKKQVAGKKANEAEEIIKKNPGVTDVEVKYSPFWVGSIPKKTDKITVIIEEPKTTEDESSQSSL
jgi:hypothetical protein